MFGLLNVNKPKGLTSRDAVNRVQRLVRPAKVGHAGTLDPIATGVLLLCLGPATKLIEHVQRMPKAYRGAFLLGRRSASDDVELTVEELPGAPIPTLSEIESALPSFVGEIQQVPPAYSAIKVAGEKSYNLARAGKPPELPPRPVTIHELTIARYDYPELALDVRCGSGTYIRALGRDLANALGTAAVMSELERTAIGAFGVADAITPEDLSRDRVEAALLPAGLAVADLPRLEVNAAEIEELRNGRFIPCPSASREGEAAAFDERGRLVALVKPRGRDRWQPVRNFGS